MVCDGDDDDDDDGDGDGDADGDDNDDERDADLFVHQADCQRGASTRGVANTHGKVVSSGHQVLDVSNHRQVHVVEQRVLHEES